jgi:hypothetical protein
MSSEWSIVNQQGVTGCVVLLVLAPRFGCCESKAPMTVAQITERVRNPVQGQVVNGRRGPREVSRHPYIVDVLRKVYAATSLCPAASAYPMPCSASCSYLVACFPLWPFECCLIFSFRECDTYIRYCQAREEKKVQGNMWKKTNNRKH